MMSDLRGALAGAARRAVPGRPRTSGLACADFHPGQHVRLCGRAFGWPVGSLLIVTRAEHVDDRTGRAYVMISPVRGSGEFGIPPTELEPNHCDRCPHARHQLGRLEDELV